MTAASRTRSLLGALGVLLVFAGIAVGVKLAVWTDPLPTIQGTQDGMQTMWFLTWTPFALTHHHNPLVSTYLNYPNGVNLLWNTSMPALSILLWPVTAVSGVITTYNVIGTGALALSAFFGFLAIRRYVHGTLAAAIGGLVFGFSPGMIAQEPAHVNVVASAVTIPLMFILLDELLVKQRMRAWLLGVLIALLGIVQFFIFTEFFATEAIAAAVTTCVLGLVFRDQVRVRLPYALRAFSVAAVIVVLVLAYPLYEMFAGPNRLHGSAHDPNGFSTDLLNPVVPTGIQLLAPSQATSLSIQFSGNGSEANGYLGIPLVLLLIAATVRFWRVPLVRVAALVAIAMGILSLGPNLHAGAHQYPIPLPWWVPGHVPVLRSIIPSRMMYFTYLASGALLAFVLHELWAARHNIVWAALVTAVVLVPLLPRLPLFGTEHVIVPPYFTSSQVSAIPSGAPVLTLPWPDASSVSAMDGMNWQWASNMQFRLLGGYFLGPTAPGQATLERVAKSFSGPSPPAPLTADERSAFLAELHANNVGAVVLGPVEQQPAAVSLFTALLGTSPSTHDGIDVWLVSTQSG